MEYAVDNKSRPDIPKDIYLAQSLASYERKISGLNYLIVKSGSVREAEWGAMCHTGNILFWVATAAAMILSLPPMYF